MWKNNGIPYSEWCKGAGKFRWYHEDGTARALYPHDYNWKSVYDVATAAADIAFHYRMIEDPEIFTSKFLSNVPQNWLQYKAVLEFLAVNFEGLTVDPDVFMQGYDREIVRTSTTDTDTTQTSVSDGTEHSTGTKNTDGNTSATTVGDGTSDTVGNTEATRNTDTEEVLSSDETRHDTVAENETIDTNGTSSTDADGSSTDKGRNVNYEMGIQAYDDLINNGNIGELGNDYASNMSDNVGTHAETSSSDTVNTSDSDRDLDRVSDGTTSIDSERTIDVVDRYSEDNTTDVTTHDSIVAHGTSEEDEVTEGNVTSSSTVDSTGTVNTSNDFTENATERRPNVYDELAVLSRRVEYMHAYPDVIKPFHEYFNKHFTSVSGYKSWF